MFNQDIVYFFSQSDIRHLQHFNNPFIQQIYSLKFFQKKTGIDTLTNRYTAYRRSQGTRNMLFHGPKCSCTYPNIDPYFLCY